MHFVLFDIDGTLIGGGAGGREALEAAFAEVFELPETPDVRGRVSFSGALDPEIHRDMAALIGISPDRLRRRSEALHDSYVRHIRRLAPRSGARVLPGVEEVLAGLEAREDVRLGLITGNVEAGARIKLEPHGLNPFFPTGGFGGDGPDRAAVASVARRRLEELAGRPPTTVTVVGDSVRDVECATANGFRAVAVATGWTDRADLRQAGPEALLDDLSDVAAVLRLLAR